MSIDDGSPIFLRLSIRLCIRGFANSTPQLRDQPIERSISPRQLIEALVDQPVDAEQRNDVLDADDGDADKPIKLAMRIDR